MISIFFLFSISFSIKIVIPFATKFIFVIPVQVLFELIFLIFLFNEGILKDAYNNKN